MDSVVRRRNYLCNLSTTKNDVKNFTIKLGVHDEKEHCPKFSKKHVSTFASIHYFRTRTRLSAAKNIYENKRFFPSSQRATTSSSYQMSEQNLSYNLSEEGPQKLLTTSPQTHDSSCIAPVRSSERTVLSSERTVSPCSPPLPSGFHC